MRKCTSYIDFVQCVSRISRMFVNRADAGPQPMLAGGASKNFAFGARYSLDGF